MKKLKSAFISYSSDGSIKADQVAGYLKPMGVDTYMYKTTLNKEDDDPSRTVTEEIEKRDALIMVLSARSSKSTWVSMEIGLALGMHKRVLIIKTAHNLKLPRRFKGRIILNKLEDLDDHFQSV